MLKRQIKKLGTLAVLALLCVFVLSGCVQMVMQANVDENGGGDVSLQLGFSDLTYGFLSGSGNEDPLASITQEAEAQGYEVEPYEENGFKGIKAKQQIDSFRTWFGSSNYTKGITFLRNKQLLNQTFDISGTAKIADTIKSSIKQMQLSSEPADIRLVITMPYKITGSNATQISGDQKTATWDLATFTDPILISATGPILLFGILPAWTVLIVLILLALAIIALIIIWLIRLSARKKQSAQQAEQIEEAQQAEPDVSQDMAAEDAEAPSIEEIIEAENTAQDAEDQPEPVSPIDEPADGELPPEDDTEPKEEQ